MQQLHHPTSLTTHVRIIHITYVNISQFSQHIIIKEKQMVSKLFTKNPKIFFFYFIYYLSDNG
jgi:hypothetical protein